MKVRVIDEDGLGGAKRWGGWGGNGDNNSLIRLINQKNRFLKFSLFDHYV